VRAASGAYSSPPLGELSPPIAGLICHNPIATIAVMKKIDAIKMRIFLRTVIALSPLPEKTGLLNNSNYARKMPI
jgi:hypothetical protein